MMERANAQAIYGLLDSLNIPFEHTAHPAAMTMEDLTDVERTLKAPFCKNLFLANRQPGSRRRSTCCSSARTSASAPRRFPKSSASAV